MFRSRWREALAFLAIAILARAITFGNPIVHVDEEFYVVAARAMANGAWPYVDIWDRKPVGLFLLYLPAASLPLPAAIWAYQAMALACVVATACAIARFARMAEWRAGATLAGVAYILWIDLAEGQGGQSPVFYNLLTIAAALLIAGERGARVWRGLAAMALVGVALQVKYSVVFEGMFFGLWIVAQHWRAHRRTGATALLAVALIAVALTPTITAAGVFAAYGHFDAFWFANFRSILQRRPDPALEQLGNFFGTTLILSPLVAMAGVTLAQRQWSATRVFLFGWLGAALLGLLLFGSWFDHYALPAMVPAAICASGAMGEHRDVRRWALPILAIVAIGGQGLLVMKRLGRGTPAQIQAMTAAIGRGPGCLWIYSGDVIYYALSGRCAPTRFVFPSHLGRERERGAIGVDQAAEVRRILATHPAVVMMRPPYRGERADIRALVLADLSREYRLTATVTKGHGLTQIYKRR